MRKTDQPQPSALEAHVGFWLRFVSNHVSSRFQQLLEARNCSVTEWVALRVLYDRREASHAELIQALGMTKGAVSKVVSRLESVGLATRKATGQDGREQVVALTKKGMALVPRLAALADENDTHFFGHLGAHGREALVNALQGLVTYHELHSPPVT